MPRNNGNSTPKNAPVPQAPKPPGGGKDGKPK